LSVLSSSTIAHTTYTQSYQGAKNLLGKLFSLFGGAKSHDIGNSFYPKTHLAYSLFSQLLVIALFGDHFESVKGSVGLSHWTGKALLTGVVASSYFLYTQAMENFFEKGARFHAKSLGAPETRLTTEAVTKLEKISEILKSCPLADFGRLLQELLPRLQDEQKEALIHGISIKNSPMSIGDFDSFIRQLHFAEQNELHAVACEGSDVGERLPLLGAGSTV
jgi:hypothetical protein